MTYRGLGAVAGCAIALVRSSPHGIRTLHRVAFPLILVLGLPLRGTELPPVRWTVDGLGDQCSG